MQTAKTLIRLGGHPSWSESSLGGSGTIRRKTSSSWDDSTGTIRTKFRTRTVRTKLLGWFAQNLIYWDNSAFLIFKKKQKIRLSFHLFWMNTFNCWCWILMSRTIKQSIPINRWGHNQLLAMLKLIKSRYERLLTELDNILFGVV